MKYEKVCIFGLGYVGLPTAAVFANKGFKVIGVDVDEKRVELINNGVCYLKEPGLSELIHKAVSEGNLRAETDADHALSECDVVLIDVPTPVKNKIVDLSYIIDVVKKTSEHLRRGNIVVIESTIPPGTTNNIVRKICESSGLIADEDFYLAHAPERIAPGKAIEHLLNLPRIVGGVGPSSTQKAAEIYRKINPNVLSTDSTTAEFVKVIENTYRDLNISYSNLLALIAENIGIDVYEAIRLANSINRVHIHQPGVGVGGTCLTKDPYMLVALLEDFWGLELINISRKLNDYMPYHTVKVIERVAKLEGIDLKASKVAVFGVAYKGGVDDVRMTPARPIVLELMKKTGEVVVYDPYTRESFGARYCESIEDAVENADMIIILTDHPEFRDLDLKTIGELMRNRILIDGRRVFEPDEAIRSGFRYYGIGYGRIKK